MTETSHLEASSELINEIGALLLQSEDLTGDWDAAALAVILDGSAYDASGFKYLPSGKTIPIAPEEKEIYTRLIALRDLEAEASGKAPWETCLIQIKRAEMSVDFQMEYENARRWKITPANLADMKAALRPE